MDLSDPTARDRWFDHLAGLVAGRRTILGVAPLAAFTEVVSLLTRAGASRPLVVYTGTGAGTLPDDGAAELVRLAVPRYPTMTEEIRAQAELLRTLPRHVTDAVEAYDPDRGAAWCTGPFTTAGSLDGRAVVGGRPASWAALEDKTVVDALWDAVGYPRAERLVVEVAATDALERASRALDLGDGVVWVAEGFNGGGELTRWVHTDDERAAARDFFRPRCERVRVMPFLEGVPCSIHGLVLPDGTVALRPVELAILRGPGRRFVYGGQGTTWDPPAEDRDRMRDLVHRTGELLRRRVGYAGGFGIDGVLTAEGFRPTELNPRFSGGLSTLARVLDVGLFILLQWNLVAGRDPGVRAADLEAWALPELDRRRTAQPKGMAATTSGERVQIAARWDGHRLHADPAGPLTVQAGPTASGLFAKIEADHAVGPGERIGPLNAAMMRLLDEQVGAGFGPVEAPPDVRTSAARRTAVTR